MAGDVPLIIWECLLLLSWAIFFQFLTDQLFSALCHNLVSFLCYCQPSASAHAPLELSRVLSLCHLSILWCLTVKRPVCDKSFPSMCLWYQPRFKQPFPLLHYLTSSKYLSLILLHLEGLRTCWRSCCTNEAARGASC